MGSSAPAVATETYPEGFWPATTTAERCVALARGVVFTTALLMMETDLVLGTRGLSALDFIAAVALIYVIGTSVLTFTGREAPSQQFPLLVADMILVTGVIFAAGGAVNEYYLLYYIPILQASVRLNFRDAIASSVLSSGLYAFVALTRGPEMVIPMSAQLRSFTFAGSSLFMAVFFGLLSREARAHLRRSEQMTRLADALGRKNRELQEKTRELAEAQDSLLARERLATIGELAASLGHELRNPLGVIRNAAYYLQTQLGDEREDVAEMVSLMEAEVGTCDRTITALLDFARPQQGTPVPIPVNEFVEMVVAKKLPPPGVTVALEPGRDLPPLLADRHQLEQVCANILANAYHAMAATGGVVTVRTWVAAEDGMMHLEWSDTGPGIPPENLGRIFDPLFTTKAKGIGLGLVVCKRYVERQGGQLAVRSEPGHGATVTISLPLAGGEQQDE